MARTRGGKRLNSKTQDPAVFQDLDQHVRKVSPPKDKSKMPYVCSTCSKEYVLRDSFLAHTVTHTKEKLKNLKPKRQHQIKPPPASSPSSTLSSPVWEKVEDRSLTVPSTREKVQGRKLTDPSARETKLEISLENPSKFSSPPSTPVTSTTLETHNREFGLSSPSSLSSSPTSSFTSLPSTLATSDRSDTSTILETSEDKREFRQTSSSSLSSDILSLFRKRPANTSSMPRGLKSATGKPALVTEVTIPSPSRPKVCKTQTCYIQGKYKEEATIIISDDEEELGTEKIPGDIGTTSGTTSRSHLDVTSFKIGEKEQDMYTTPLKATNVSYEDSVTAGNVSHSYINDVSQSDTNVHVITSDDDEPSPPWKPGSAKKNKVSKRLFSNLLQNNEPLNMLRRLGPGITITKATSENSTKTNSDTFYKEETKEAIDKIRKLGPAISFSRAK